VSCNGKVLALALQHNVAAALVEVLTEPPWVRWRLGGLVSQPLVGG
jgi:hypothetical protein